MLQSFKLKQSIIDLNFYVTMAHSGSKLPGNGRFYLGYHGLQGKAISSEIIYICILLCHFKGFLYLTSCCTLLELDRPNKSCTLCGRTAPTP